ncbi:MAG: transcriptional regulator [Rhizobiales bacterium]|nr:transcriptional regulator [Hyphomicrobiales bacterium]
MSQTLFENAQWLVGAIARGLHARSGEGVNEVLEGLSQQALGQSHFRAPEPTQLPVLRHFAQCTAESMLFDADLAAALAAVADHLRWRQSASYNDSNLGEGFLENYGWSQIIGPHGFFPGRDFLLGLIMLGPHRHYKDHYHPAPELYWPLTGPSEWKRNEGTFEAKPAGDTIWHRPNVIHATKTTIHPLLAVWCWTSDTATPAKLVGP